MADAYARNSGTAAALTVHQGCGLTNAMTGITEAAKSRTPLVVVAAEATQPGSNFYVDQPALAAAVGAVSVRITSAETAAQEAADAVALARNQRRTVVLNLPLEIQAREATPAVLRDLPSAALVDPDPAAVAALSEALEQSRRPVFIAGRGARSEAARQALLALADTCGALVATSAVAKGLFRDHPWSLDVSGGFSSPLTAELIAGADLVVGWGCALNMWTMRHGALIAEDAVVAQVDDTAEALGAHRKLDLAVHGDTARTAESVAAILATGRIDGGKVRTGYRSQEVRERLDGQRGWRDVPFEDLSTTERIDPRTLTLALDTILPRERVVAVDSGNFMGYPSMFLSVPDEQGFCFTQAFQSIGLGLATAIGAALSRPDRLPVAALGDGGALMGISELDTVVRLGLPMVVVVYDDAAYGAEVHHFGPDGHDTGIVRFPDTDIAAIARGYGFTSVTVRTLADLSDVADWVASPRGKPLLVDAKIVADEPSWWLAEAFGH
jgi:thiamine pyrophosphate-dependent acetolactate synthase large subunit-like protein